VLPRCFTKSSRRHVEELSHPRHVSSATLIALTATTATAIAAIAIAILSLSWNIWSFWVTRRFSGRPNVLATIVEGTATVAPPVIATVNAGYGVARHLLFLAADQGELVQGGATASGILLPHETGTRDLPVKAMWGRRDLPMVWACMDAAGNIYARANDGRTKRYKARNGQIELGTIFRDVYPRHPVDKVIWQQRPELWIGE